MIRGSDFYSIYLGDGLWSTDEDDVIRIVDAELDAYAKEHYENDCRVLYMWDSSSGVIDAWHKYVQRQARDNFVMLDEKLIFSNTDVKRTDYASHKLSYPLEEGDISAWDKLVGTLYLAEERHKIEWAIGAIVSGDSKELQKFMVFYGAAGTGKSTIINVIQMLFDGYYSVFDAKSLGSSNNAFALEAFKTNPLVAIQHDGDLSHIEDNTRLNSLVSHEMMTVNEKFRSAYSSRFKSFLIMGTNKPVRITDAKSGLLRRLIDVHPSGNKLSGSEYKKVMSQIKFELGAIAKHCLDVYLENPGYYDNYIPISMIGATNDFYNFLIENYEIFNEQDGTSLAAAWALYNEYCEKARVGYPMTRRAFQEELKNYFREFKDRMVKDDGTRVRSYYIGFLKEKFEQGDIVKELPKGDGWVFKMDASESLLDRVLADCFAQYAKDDGTPKTYWDKVYTRLKSINTSMLHYVQVPEKHIVIDFDLKDRYGNKSFELNAEAASHWPETYAELSKGGQGIHLHYIYDGDTSELSNIYDEGIEVKVFVGNSELRRRLTRCNDIPIAHITSGLPKRKEKKSMVADYSFKSEQDLQGRIVKCLHKEYDGLPGTKVNVEFIKKILDDAYEQGLHYDLRNMYDAILSFAIGSTHHSEYCCRLVDEMKLVSEEETPSIPDEDKADSPYVFFDVEVFPNLFNLCYVTVSKDEIEGYLEAVKNDGFKTALEQLSSELRSKCVSLINPSPNVVENFIQNAKLIGFNNRKYDNHIIYARMMGYTEKMLYNLSQKIISEHDGYLREAYNQSYTDIYDFASAGNKKSLKKLEIEMGIHHQELGLPWDEPVPEELWEKVASYCCNDVIATVAAFVYLQSDFIAREILADLACGTVNDTTNQLTTKFIFEGNKEPQSEFCYRNLAEPFIFNERDRVLEFLEEAKPDMMKQKHGPAGSDLPYFPGYTFAFGKSTYREVNESNEYKKVVGEGGYVYAENGIFYSVALLDVASMHPNSLISECLFGPYYTKRFKDILDARVLIKHEDWENAKTVLGGQLKPYVEKAQNGEITSKDLSNALKTAVNSVYGLTSAKFPNAFKDSRNIDNIVAKRGALFMIDLKNAVEAKGYKVVHIKTDSIKIAEANQSIIQFVMDFGKKYGYDFEHEATYDRMCLVNDAVYIAKYATAEWCEEEYGIIPGDNKKKGGTWTATGAQFQVPYVFKSLFSQDTITFDDMCSTINVDKGSLYLDVNESLPDVSGYEKALEKAKNDYKKGKLSDISYDNTCRDLETEIAKGHNYIFVGRVGQFCPMKDGCDAGILRRVQDGKYYSPSGTKGYRWLESETVRNFGLESMVERGYYDEMCKDALDTIGKYGDVDEFIFGEEQPNTLPF